MEDDLPDAPPAATEGATDFDLDTSVSGYVDKPSTVTQAVESLNLSHNPQPWLGARQKKRCLDRRVGCAGLALPDALNARAQGHPPSPAQCT